MIKKPDLVQMPIVEKGEKAIWGRVRRKKSLRYFRRDAPQPCLPAGRCVSTK